MCNGMGGVQSSRRSPCAVKDNGTRRPATTRRMTCLFFHISTVIHANDQPPQPEGISLSACGCVFANRLPGRVADGTGGDCGGWRGVFPLPFAVWAAGHSASLPGGGCPGRSQCSRTRTASLAWLDRRRVELAVCRSARRVPGQFGLQGWWPVRASKSPTPTAGMTADGWVDAGDAGWVEDDVQVALTFAMVGPAPGNAGSKRTETLLWIGVKVTNTGTRTVDFTGWEAETPSSPILTTTSGTNIAARRTDKLTPTKLTQGKFTECLLAFEVPPAGQAIRLELPASAHGGTTPARFQIAPELILRK